MTSRRRLLAALDRGIPDRLPVTTHHLMPSFLDGIMGGMTPRRFFDRFGLDAVLWLAPVRADEASGRYHDPAHRPGPAEPRRIVTEEWRIETEDLPDQRYRTIRYYIHTPRRDLTSVLQSDAHTTWVAERLLKSKSDLEIVAAYAPVGLCDTDAVNRAASDFGERGILRGAVPGFDIYGQPGCWQDAAALYGIEELILAAYDDPCWVRELLAVLQGRKLQWAQSLHDAEFDLIELGGGDASSTVISPAIFEEFVAPFDKPLVEAVQRAGRRVVYHICGGIMPILPQLLALGPDAVETFTPPDMGGDADLSEAKRMAGNSICMIGGFDQAHFFKGVDPERTREEVRRCFREAGCGGAYILSPSDHFFDADMRLLDAYAEEAAACVYDVTEQPC